MSASLPDPNAAAAQGRDQSTVITDRNGRLLAKLFAEQNRSDQPLSKIPMMLAEGGHLDRGPALLRALRRRSASASLARSYTDVVLRRKAQGGSTITQQYVKQAFVGDESSMQAQDQRSACSLSELRSATRKDQILEYYLNTIYFGHGAYGVESASQVYFGKTVSKLNARRSRR